MAPTDPNPSDPRAANSLTPDAIRRSVEKSTGWPWARLSRDLRAKHVKALRLQLDSACAAVPCDLADRLRAEFRAAAAELLKDPTP
jgi:hypothetical protein